MQRKVKGRTNSLGGNNRNMTAGANEDEGKDCEVTTKMKLEGELWM